MTDATSRATLEEIKAFGAALGPWAHLATVGADGEPDVVPVHPCWEGDILWTMTGTASTKVRNVLANPAVALHWQVAAAGDGLELWGRATFHDDLDTKRRLWQGVFDYDLNRFAPGGPDDSPGTGFLAVVPTRALIIRGYGAGGTSPWRA